MADNDDDAAIERLARKIFELQNPGQEWRADRQADTAEQERCRALAKKELGSQA